MPRIYPIPPPPPRKLTKGEVFKKWMLAFMGLPLCLCITPISCCVRNPVAHVLYDEEPHGSEHISENIEVGLFGICMGIACCGCCCGHCCTESPRDF